LDRQVAETATALDRARRAQAERTARLASQTQALKQLEQQAAESPLQALQQRRTGLQAAAAGWYRARELQREAAGLAQQAEGDRRALADAARNGADAAKLAVGAAQVLNQSRAALNEARRALHLLQAASNRQTGELRALLREGEPCPVCGALTHPWQQHSAPLDEEVQAQRDRVQALQDQCDTQLAIQAAQRQRQTQAENEQQRLQPRLVAAEARLAAVATAWRALPEPQRPAPEPQAIGVAAVLDQALAETERRLRELDDSERQALSLEAEIKDRRRGLERLQGEERTQAEGLHGLERKQQGLVERLASQTQQASMLDLQLGQMAETLADPLRKIPNWRPRLETGPDALQRDCAAWVGAWREQQDNREEAASAVKTIDPALTGAGEARKQAEERLAEQARLTEQAQARLRQLRMDRGRLLDGRPADQVEQSLEQALSGARERKDRCAAGLNDSRQALVNTQQAIQHWEQEQQRRRRGESETKAELEQALQAQGLEAAELIALLQRDHGWIRTERQALQDLQLGLERTRALHLDAQRRHHQHAADAPEAGREQIETALADARSELQRKRNGLAEHTALIKQDDARRERSRQLLGELETQRREWELWGGLKELIGSADGKKFRGFAQGLTLDSLLVHANLHLQDLARRYRLQRVPGSDLELQVIDTDMGDEVRSVHSLSGGESFLVSLALALGLASLSSSRTQVESLFIDEGFGSLDQDTLDLALASLDTLQSLGRKVGVISHVQAMVERIGAQVLVEKRGAGQSRVRVEVQA
jgi:exonuclease SbcC